MLTSDIIFEGIATFVFILFGLRVTEVNAPIRFALGLLIGLTIYQGDLNPLITIGLILTKKNKINTMWKLFAQVVGATIAFSMIALVDAQIASDTNVTTRHTVFGSLDTPTASSTPCHQMLTIRPCTPRPPC